MGFETKAIQKQMLFNFLTIKENYRTVDDCEFELRASMDESDIALVEKQMQDYRNKKNDKNNS